MGATMSEWTDQRIELLKELWLDGATSTKICARLEISRSAVLGKIKRLGLNHKVLDARENQPSPKPQPVHTPPAAADPVKVAPPAGTPRQSLHAHVTVPSRNRTPPPLDMLTKTFSAESALPAAPANSNGKPKASKYLSIWDLRDGCCKWPMGELLDRPEFFCGATTNPGSP